MRVVWSKRATSRVSEIALYIAQDSPQNAQQWVEGIFGAVEGIADFPEMGKPGRDVTAPGVRELVFGTYRVFYEIGTMVDILTGAAAGRSSTRTTSVGGTDLTKVSSGSAHAR